MSDNNSLDGTSRSGEVSDHALAAEQVDVANREGGASSTNLGGGNAASESIAEPALGQPSPPQFPASPSNLQPTSALSTFNFVAPVFSNPVQPEMSQLFQNRVSGGVPSSQPSASKDTQSGGDQTSAGQPVLPSFSTMSAKALANFIGGRIQNFKPEVWIAEDVSGAAFLEVVSPSGLTEFLEQNLRIDSKFQRTRIENLLRELIVFDKSITESVRKPWTMIIVPVAASDRAVPPTGGQILSPAHPPNCLVRQQEASKTLHFCPRSKAESVFHLTILYCSALTRPLHVQASRGPPRTIQSQEHLQPV
jgi:hypothetical protein